MTDLRFFADLVTTGTALGLDHTSTVAEVEAVLGPSQTWRLSRTQLRRTLHTGLVEFAWDWPDPEPLGLSARAGNLFTARGRVGEALTAHYGRFRRKPPTFTELRVAVAARGFTLVPDNSITPDNFRYAYEPTIGTSVTISADPEVPGEYGRIWSITGTTHRTDLTYHHPPGRQQGFADRARFLKSQSPGQIRTWLHRHDPSTDRTTWWRQLIAPFPRDHPLRPLLLAEALNRKVNPPGVDAVNLILALPPEDPALPTAVRAWLDNPPAALPEAERLAHGPSLTPDEIRLSRRLRDQIHVLTGANPRLPHDLAAALDPWKALRPNLLRYPLFARPRHRLHKARTH
ncbi:hypothetical protein V5P93_006871 [Actinokineospora auranticolor]|uniref:Uncharacterized protein n=1 Tax=Actinokineospora auranticolor TaxID=155976 RepID=A0A2S6GW62_9PSEU|nr:hypothetical protein [Actinokineospora auranticolor]PPK69485.1 hypothetical protein CLV40_10392 [Actinokineospora auranticolor]